MMGRKLLSEPCKYSKINMCNQDFDICTPYTGAVTWSAGNATFFDSRGACYGASWHAFWFQLYLPAIVWVACIVLSYPMQWAFRHYARPHSM